MMKKIAEFFSFVFNKFKHNWGLKILSFLFAILLWNSVVTSTNPEVSRTVPDVPITIIGVEQFSEKNLALLKSISSSVRSAKVTLDIKRNDLSKFDENDENIISLTLDLSKIPATGTYDIKLIATTTQGTVSKVVPDSIEVEVDEKEDRVIPVDCEVVGELGNNYHRGPLSLTPNAIQVSGAKSIVQEIEKAYLRLDLNDRIESINLPKEYTLIDKSGSAIDASSLIISHNEVLLEMVITPKKTLKITAALLGEDKIAEGYEIIDISVEPETIEVTGAAEWLEGLTSLPLEAIDLTGHFESIFIQELKILPIDYIELLGAKTASVLIEIGEKMSEVIFEQVSIELRNVPSGFEIQDFDAKIDITVRAPSILINNIAPSHITLFVDMTGAKEGETVLPILYEVPEEYRVESVVLAQDTVKVILK